MRLLSAVLVCVAAACCLQADSVLDTRACDNPVYCYGDLLDLVQRSNVFEDSKTFVDRPLKSSPENVLSSFSALKPSLVSNVSLLQEFVYNWTLEAGSDLLSWQPNDWVEMPKFVPSIKDTSLRQWAVDLNSLWKEFGRQVSPSVGQSPDQHSLISVPHPFIVPGGRFREFHYWDSYWIIKGLLLCEMFETAENMIYNLVSMVDRYGMVPNGGRVYYTKRSQPPLLTQMVELVYNTTRNDLFLESLLPSLVREYEFWMRERVVQVDGYSVNLYAVDVESPRPESYKEDWMAALEVDPSKRSLIYSNLASAAESGWDISSRWLSNRSISSIRTRSIVPVDLNAILCQNEQSLTRLFDIVGNGTESARFNRAWTQRKLSFDLLFWDETQGFWVDWDLDVGKQTEGLYASTLVPLLWGCGQNVTKHRILHSKLSALGMFDYAGGIPTSLTANGSGQQWDFPNVWAPLQWFPVLAWQQSPVQALRETALSIAHTWLQSTHAAWETFNHTMFENYNGTTVGLPGGGGEHSTQSGFGWTNGVTLHFLVLYPNITLPQVTMASSLGWISVPVLLVIFVTMVTTCIVWCHWMNKTGERRYWRRVQNERLIAASGGRVSPTTYTNQYVDQHSDVDQSEQGTTDDDRELFTWDV